MKTRTDLINFLIQKHGLKSYLEVGVQNPAQNFDKIQCETKISVDPDPNAKATYCVTSDHFFLLHQSTFDSKFDLVFIDGLHTAEQVEKDFNNALKVLSPNGFIVLHDCNPLKEEHTIVPRPKPQGHWNGDVYKFAVELGKHAFRFFTVDIDNGCGVWVNNGLKKMTDVTPRKYNWSYFDKNRDWMLNLISWDDFIKDYGND